MGRDHRPLMRPDSVLRRLAWASAEPPSVETVTQRLRDEGVEPYAWSNGPGDQYAVHQHGYTKLLMCTAGSITFLVGPSSAPIELRAGDGFVLPAGTPHAARVGPAGCTCLEGHRGEG
jgi:quercetin dioxygenase-like cupin family protein